MSAIRYAGPSPGRCATSISRSRPARCWRSSARTAPARPPSSSCWRASTTRPKGRVLLDGRDLRDYDLDELRARIGVIFQDFVRFHFTAAENIGVGRIDELGRPRRASRTRRPAASPTADRRAAAAATSSRSAAASTTASTCRAANGRRSRSRGPTCGTADVLILDEPTAALDARAEYEVFERFKDLSRGRPRSSSRTASRPCAWPTASWCWATAGCRDGHPCGARGGGRPLCRVVRPAGRRLSVRLSRPQPRAVLGVIMRQRSSEGTESISSRAAAPKSSQAPQAR